MPVSRTLASRNPMPIFAMALRLFRRILPAVALAVCPSLHAADASGSLSLTSDYVFRGVSQSGERPALQAGVRIESEAGFYGSAWASRVDFANAPSASAEIDYVIGVRRKLGDDWVGDANATWFTYAGAPELDYLEWIATATWRDRHWIMLGVSSDVFATGRHGTYVQAGTRLPLNDALRIELAGGYYRLHDAYARDYGHAQATLAWLPTSRVELRLSGHLPDHNARVLFGDLAAQRLEASLQATF